MPFTNCVGDIICEGVLFQLLFRWRKSMTLLIFPFLFVTVIILAAHLVGFSSALARSATFSMTPNLTSSASCSLTSSSRCISTLWNFTFFSGSVALLEMCSFSGSPISIVGISLCLHALNAELLKWFSIASLVLSIFCQLSSFGVSVLTGQWHSTSDIL